jgi:thioredoxin-like negative regulator of GroEL
MSTTDPATVGVNADGAATPRPQLLFFYSRTSGSSRRAEGFLAQVLQRRRNHTSFRLVPIDVEQHPELVERFRVEEIPALVVVADKRVRARVARPRGCAEIAETLRPWLT